MDLGLRDRVVAVTGASKGIGRACAAAFAAEGARVALVSRSRANLDAALAAMPAGASVQAFAADLVDAVRARATVDAIERALGPIDVLVNCAGARSAIPRTSSMLPRGARRWTRSSSATSTRPMSWSSAWPLAGAARS